MSALDLLPEPLERLNYYNGQRLEAIDFRAEQAYHMRVRRALNRALYSAGIGAGLEVKPDQSDPHAVVVSPGLALDPHGRELILFEPRRVMACGTPRRADGVTFGNYLVISYHEEKVAPLSDGCRVLGVYDDGADACGCKGTPARKTNSCGGDCAGGCGCGGKCGGDGCSCGTAEAQAYAWGAPSRIRSEPQLLFQDAWPTETSGRILLAQIELDAQCRVIGIKSGMRRYASASKPPNTMPISLGGEKDIDADNALVLRFHIDGGYPDSAKLYLRGAEFSSLFYTEMGRHGHGVGVTLDPSGAIAPHDHALGGLKTAKDGGHSHAATGSIDEVPNDGDNVFMVNDTGEHTADLVAQFELKITGGDHEHGFPDGAKTQSAAGVDAHNHTVHVTQSNAGVSDKDARSGGRHRYLKNMTVSFVTGSSASIDVTSDVLAQLEAADPGNWSQLGNGNAGHALNKGTPAIDLRQISGIDLSPGMHQLVFAVPNGEGGQLQYNLYVS